MCIFILNKSNQKSNQKVDTVYIKQSGNRCVVNSKCDDDQPNIRPSAPPNIRPSAPPNIRPSCSMLNAHISRGDNYIYEIYL